MPRSRFTRSVGPIVALAAATLLSGCGGSDAAVAGYVPGETGLTRIAVADRKPAPALSGTTLDGSEFTSAAAQGKVIVYNVWGSWCAPCRHEAPEIEAAWVATAGVAVFVGINSRDPDPAQARAFVRAFGVTYPSVYDPKGEVLLKFAGLLPPTGIPSTLVVDGEGRVAARVVGETTRATLIGLVTDATEGR